jgi:hypothetical protein
MCWSVLRLWIVDAAVVVEAAVVVGGLSLLLLTVDIIAA